MGEDGFVTVTKKGRSKKHKNNQTNTTIIRSQVNPDTREKIDVTKAVSKTNSAVVDIEASELFEELKVIFTNIGRIGNIRCYGLGHVGECVTARYQLALLICIKNLLDLEQAQIQLFDPIFFEEEVEILSLLGLTVSTTNTECKDTAVGIESLGKTLFYLPHCPKQMTNNLLWANWSPDCLPSCVLLANSLASVVNRTTTKMMNKEAVFIKTVVEEEMVIEKPLSNSFKYTDVFNDLSVHTFPSKFDSSHNQLWNLPEPSYEESDTEFITAKFTDITLK